MNTEKPKNSTLVVVVDAVQLFKQEITPQNQEQIIDKYVALLDPDGFGSPFGQPNKNQVTVVNEGTEMIWSITTLVKHEGIDDDGSDYDVILEYMEQEILDPKKNKGFFKEGIKIKANTKNQIEGHVETDKSVKNGDEERYFLCFHMMEGDLIKDSMIIDPKLQIRKKEPGIKE